MEGLCKMSNTNMSFQLLHLSEEPFADLLMPTSSQTGCMDPGWGKEPFHLNAWTAFEGLQPKTKRFGVFRPLFKRPGLEVFLLSLVLVLDYTHSGFLIPTGQESANAVIRIRISFTDQVCSAKQGIWLWLFSGLTTYIRQKQNRKK